MASWENEISRMHKYILEAIKASGLTASNIGVIPNEVQLVLVEEVGEEKLSMDACFEKAFLMETAK
jgi:hypothetical protein